MLRWALLFLVIALIAGALGIWPVEALAPQGAVRHPAIASRLSRPSERRSLRIKMNCKSECPPGPFAWPWCAGGSATHI